MLGEMKSMCDGISCEPEPRLRVNGLEAIRGGFKGYLKGTGHQKKLYMITYVLADHENVIIMSAIACDPKASQVIKGLEQSLLTFERPGYKAPKMKEKKKAAPPPAPKSPWVIVVRNLRRGTTREASDIIKDRLTVILGEDRIAEARFGPYECRVTLAGEIEPQELAAQIDFGEAKISESSRTIFVKGDQLKLSQTAAAIGKTPPDPDDLKADLAVLASDETDDRDRNRVVERLLKVRPEDVADKDVRTQMARSMRDIASNDKFPERSRVKAIRGLVAWAETFSVPILVNLLDDKSASVRREVVIVLGELGDERAVEPLAERFTQNAPERVEITQALRAFGPRAESAVLKHAKSDDPNVLKPVITLLSEIGTPKSLRFLLRLRKNRKIGPVLEEDIEAATEAIKERAAAAKDGNR